MTQNSPSSFSSSSAREPIAIVGISALFPGSTEVGGFWRDIVAGTDLLSDVPSSHWLIEDYYAADPAAPDKTYGKRGGFISPIQFDPVVFGIPPSIVPSTDPAQLLALVVAQQVLEDATRGQFHKLDRSGVSVILGVASTTELAVHMAERLQRPVWLKALRDSGVAEPLAQTICDRIAASYHPWQESTFPGLLGNVVAGRIANRLNLGGTNCVVDAACASSLSAVAMAVNELHLGQAELVIAGGVDALNDILMFMCFSKTPALSPTGDCRPFSARADGTMLGEGLGMLALRRLADAERDGNHIYALLRGVGTSSDGRAKSVYAPRPEGQAQALRRAYRAAGYGPETVELVEAHGTGTVAGDAAEIAGLSMVFGEAGRTDRQWCALGSVKSQIGHTKAAAGAAGLIKAVLAVHHQVLPPTIKIEQPSPHLDLENSPFYLNTEARPWIRDSAHPRRASVSAFGFGGSNFHVAVEEYRGPGRRPLRTRSSPSELIVLYAESPTALEKSCRSLIAELEGPAALLRLARSTQLAPPPNSGARLAIVADSADDLRRKLLRAAELVATAPPAHTDPSGIYYSAEAALGKVALIFPGQGSQYVGMGGELAMAFPQVRAVWDRAADPDSAGGKVVHRAVFPPPGFGAEARAAQEQALTQTELAQPAIGLCSASMLELLRELGLTPDCVAGHSFGEVTALFAAGVLTEAAMLQVARERGALMAQAATVPGAMLAVSSADVKIEELLAARGLADRVCIANYNSPSQVVLAGAVEAIAEAERLCAEERVTTRRLPVSAAFHSPLVKGASDGLRAALAKVPFVAPQVPVFGSADAAIYSTDENENRERLAAQLKAPVRFVAQVAAMYERGVRTFVEVGPGSALTGLIAQCCKGRPHRAVSLDRKGQPGLTSLWQALGQLVVAGVQLDFAPLWSHYAAPERNDQPTPKLTIPVSGTIINKPYPPKGGAGALPPPNQHTPNASSPSPGLEPRPLSNHPTPPSPTLEPRPANTAAPRSSGLPPLAQPSASVSAVRVDDAWLHAFCEVQRQTAEAHSTYQRATAESHQAFLRTAEAFSLGLASLAGESAPRTPQSGQLARAGLSAAPYRAPALRTPPQLLPAPPRPASAALPADDRMVPGPAASPASRPRPAPTPVAAPVAASVDLRQVLLAVVAEKTGYPPDVLSLDAEMEGGLGIDSIKRVEILSGMQEKVPGLPEVQTKQMAALRTLGDVLALLERASGASSPAKVAPPAEVARAAVPPGAKVEAKVEAKVDLKEALLAVVAEKTGYPAEVLSLDAEMEGGLGIDSIKRVEILSGMQERVPGLPEVQTKQMAALRTLGDVLNFLQRGTEASDAAPSVDAEPTRPFVHEPAVYRAVVEMEARPAGGFVLPTLLGAGGLVITEDGGGVAAALGELLRARGCAVQVAKEVPAEARGVIYLGGLQEVADVEAALAVSRDAFRAAQALARSSAQAPKLFVTVQDTGGDFGLRGSQPARAWLGGLPALAKTAAHEWPSASVKSIDLERGQRTAKALAAAVLTELLTGGTDLEVGLRSDGTRSVLVVRNIPLSQKQQVSSAATADSPAVWLVTGGARGITAATLLALAAQHKPRVALLGRTALVAEPASCHALSTDAELKRALHSEAQAAGLKLTPVQLTAQVGQVVAGREIRATLAALAAVGAQAHYFPVDLRAKAATGAAVAEIRHRLGSITGFIHGAGMLADKLLTDKTQAQFDAVFDTKVGGLRALLDATREEPLRLICLYSSIAAREGNAGQSDYAMANAILNQVATAEAARRGPGCVVKSIGWGPWDGGMVTPALREHFRKRAIPLIPIAGGAAALVAELADSPREQVEILLTAGSLLAPNSAAPKAVITREVLVEAERAPYLNSHRVRDVAVLPAVLVLEWFARAAGYGERFALREVKILRGAALPQLAQAGHRFLLTLAAAEPRRTRCELRSEDGSLLYSAAVEPPIGMSAPPDGPPLGQVDAADPRAIYDQRLFHGPDFQVLRTLGALTAEAGEATLIGTEQLGWPGGPFILDPAALDGALQLALLWRQSQGLGRSLPTQIGALLVHKRPPAGVQRCLLRRKHLGRHRLVVDLQLVASDGSTWAELADVEMHVLPGGEG